MHIDYKLNTNELDASFLESVKIMFKDKDKDKDIHISIIDNELYEDIAMGQAIEIGLLTETVPREELNKVLHAD